MANADREKLKAKQISTRKRPSYFKKDGNAKVQLLVFEMNLTGDL